MRVKICGLTQPDQAQAVASLGAHALGFICVPATARYVPPERLAMIAAALPPLVFKVGVFVDAPVEQIVQTVRLGRLQAVQLHGSEAPAACRMLAEHLPGTLRIKALRVREAADLAHAFAYGEAVDALLLDAWHPQMAGGTGLALDWQQLVDFRPPLPWILAGGLRPDNLAAALALVRPAAVDLSSGVEDGTPGIKNIAKVARVLEIAAGAGDGVAV